MVSKVHRNDVTVSVVNFTPIWGEKSANLDKIIRMVTISAQEGTNIIAFPELALSGFECSEEVHSNRKPCAMHIGNAETIPGPSTEKLAEFARKLNIYIILGMPERNRDNPRLIYDSVAVIGPEGILGKYRKIYLSPPPLWTEQFCFRPGNELPVFETEYGFIGVLICADFWENPELSRILWLKGARLIFNCSALDENPGRKRLVSIVTECRGYESFVYTATANLSGKERTITYCGCSAIAGPDYPRFNRTFAKGKTGEEVITTTLSFEKLEKMWSIIDLRKAHQTKLIADEYSKLSVKDKKAGDSNSRVS